MVGAVAGRGPRAAPADRIEVGVVWRFGESSDTQQPGWRQVDLFAGLDGDALGAAPPPARSRPRWRRPLAIALVGVIVGGGAIAGLGPALRVLASGFPQITTVALPASDLQTPAAAVYKKLAPSVVLVTNQSTVNGLYGPQGQTAWGSGVIFNSAGYIVTNDHVVAGAQKVTVTLSDGHSYPATVVGEDASTDLAVIKISAGETLQPATFANSNEVVPGQLAIAIGNPLGPQFAQSVTEGIVGAIRPMLYGLNGSTPRVTKMIQVDTPINPGNSGGALADAAGDVIGITSMKVAQTGEANVPATGLGFAIPSNTVSKIVGQLVQYGHVNWPWLGVEISPNPPDALPSQAQTLTVEAVESGSPAASAGLQQGDVLTSWNGQQVLNYFNLVQDINKSQPGDTVSLGIDRDGQASSVNVTLGTEPLQQAQAASSTQSQSPPPQQQPSGGSFPFPFPFPFPFGPSSSGSPQ